MEVNGRVVAGDKANDYIYQYIVAEVRDYLMNAVGERYGLDRSIEVSFEANTEHMTVHFILSVRDNSYYHDGSKYVHDKDIIWSKRVTDHTKLMTERVAAEVSLLVNS